MNEPTVFTVPVHTKQPAKIGENVTFSLIFAHTLHTAAEPAVRSAVKILVSQRNDTIKAFFFAANKNKNSAQVPLASTSS